jgi:hypothetical protein
VCHVGYRELPSPAPIRDLVETAWVLDGPGNVVRVLPDGCMDLIWMDGRVMVAGPDTTASLSRRGAAQNRWRDCDFGQGRYLGYSACPQPNSATSGSHSTSCARFTRAAG